MPQVPTKKIIYSQAAVHQPLPNLEQPSIRIHAELFEPMLAVGWQHKFNICITNAFTKYALVTAVEN